MHASYAACGSEEAYMAFDLLAWVLDAGLSAAVAKVGKRLGSKTLASDLGDAISSWASQLPADAQLHPGALFPQVVEHEELATRPQLQALQAQLQQQRVPTLVQWHQALIEQWLRIRNHAGGDAQAFFRLREEDARAKLFELARALVRVCENDETFFRSAVVEHLEALRQDTPLLPLPLQHTGAVDVKGLATRISETGASVFMVLHDQPSKTLTLWVEVGSPTMADLKFRWASMLTIASAAPGVDYIELGTCNAAELRGSDARGHIGTMRLRFPIAAAKDLAATRRLTPEFWQNASVFIIEPTTDNTAYQQWFRVPFSNLEVPLAPSR
jgi:hypothetical protein